MQFGDKVRKLRAGLGLTQQTVADRMASAFRTSAKSRTAS